MVAGGGGGGVRRPGLTSALYFKQFSQINVRSLANCVLFLYSLALIFFCIVPISMGSEMTIPTEIEACQLGWAFGSIRYGLA